MPRNKSRAGLDYDGGWYEDQEEIDRIASELRDPFFCHAAPTLVGSGKKVINLLYKNFGKLDLRFPHQTQKIGDCVAFGSAMAIDCLAVTEIVNGERERWAGMTATEYIYSTSRVNIGGNKLRGDGSVGAWAVKAMKKYGTLVRKKYRYVDLTEYSGSRAKQWGSKGLPKSLIDIGDDHVIDQYTICRNAGDVCDALANDNPVIICSYQGFENRRDREGFARPKGRWAHCMAAIGVDTVHRRPGVLINNSWPRNWISGPKRHEQPDASFWVDLDVIDKMCRSMGDVWAITGFNGYPKASKRLDFDLRNENLNDW